MAASRSAIRPAFQEVERMRKSTIGLALLLTGFVSHQALPAAPPGAQPPSGGPADLVLRGGAIYTVNALRAWADAIAIRKDTIVYVRTDNGVAPFLRPRT